MEKSINWLRNIKHATHFKIGDTIVLTGDQDGYTHFKIEKILPDINWEKRFVRLRAVGKVTGFEKEEAEKTIFLDQLKKPKSQKESIDIDNPINSQSL